jgi:hypothetical protein
LPAAAADPAAAPVTAPLCTWQLLLLFNCLPCDCEDLAAPPGVLNNLCTALLPLVLSLLLLLDMLL